LLENGYHTVGYPSHVIFRDKYHFNQGFKDYSMFATEHGDIKYVSTSKQVTDLAIQAIDKPIQKPFFMWLHYFDPHNNYLRHEKFDFGKGRIDRYDSEIAFTDYHVGRLLDRMGQKGLMKNTVILITADHGEEFRDHGGILHTKTLYEEVLRIPLILYVPGFKAGRMEQTLSAIDFAPTMLSLVNVPIPEQFQGKPLPAAKGRFLPFENRPVFAETLEQADKRAVREGRWKLIHDRESDTLLLFDLIADPEEKQDLSEKRPDLVKRLKNRLVDYHSRSSAPAPTTEMSKELEEKLKSLGYMQ
jgi:arylsulfatase A-like enzyme